MAIDEKQLALREKMRRIAARHRQERAELVQALEDTLADNEQLAAAAEEGESLRAEHDTLRGQVKSGDFRKAFDAAATKAGVRPELLDDAWELARIDQAAERPDPKAIGQALETFLEARPHYKAEADGAGGEEAPPAGQGEAKADKAAGLAKGAGHARGANGAGPQGKYVVDRANLNNFEWMRENQAKFNQAATDGNIHFIGTPQ